MQRTRINIDVDSSLWHSVSLLKPIINKTKNQILEEALTEYLAQFTGLKGFELPDSVKEKVSPELKRNMEQYREKNKIIEQRVQQIIKELKDFT